MPRRRTKITPGHFYHIYNRGNNRKPIFLEEANYLFFLKRMRHYFPPCSVRIHAYCLMPTHFHFLVELLTEYSLSACCKNLSISYAKAMNKRYRRTGHIFEGRFKIKEVDTTKYLLTLSRYIHANPACAKVVEKAELWPYSSYQDYLGLRGGTLPYKTLILQYYRSALEYRRFVERYSEREYKERQEIDFAKQIPRVFKTPGI